METITLFNELPIELVQSILKLLPLEAVLPAAFVCKGKYEYLSKEKIWKFAFIDTKIGSIK